MDSKARKKLLEEHGFGKKFIDEIVEADRQAEEAGVTDELVRKTIENQYLSSYKPAQERSWLHDKYTRAVEFIRKYF